MGGFPIAKGQTLCIRDRPFVFLRDISKGQTLCGASDVKPVATRNSVEVEAWFGGKRPTKRLLSLVRYIRRLRLRCTFSLVGWAEFFR